MKTSNNLVCPSCGSNNLINKDCQICLEFRCTTTLNIPTIKSNLTEKFSNYTKNSGLDAYKSSEPMQESDYYPKYIPKGSELILDVGGGDGNALAKFARENQKSRVYVCDTDLSNLIKVPTREISNLYPICCQADMMPFSNGSVDVIFSLFMVEHMEDYVYSDFLFSAAKLLKPEGKLIIATDAPFYDKYVHPILRFLKTRKWMTTRFLEKYDALKPKIHHHNLKSAIASAKFIEKHGFFVQGIQRHLFAGRHFPFNFFYELSPPLIMDIASTMYVISCKNKS